MLNDLKTRMGDDKNFRNDEEDTTKLQQSVIMKIILKIPQLWKLFVLLILYSCLAIFVIAVDDATIEKKKAKNKFCRTALHYAEHEKYEKIFIVLFQVSQACVCVDSIRSFIPHSSP